MDRDEAIAIIAARLPSSPPKWERVKHVRSGGKLVPTYIPISAEEDAARYTRMVIGGRELTRKEIVDEVSSMRKKAQEDHDRLWAAFRVLCEQP